MTQIPDEEIKLVNATGKNMDDIAGGGGSGWIGEWGQEIIHKEIVSRLKPNDIVLDLASGNGRASNVFSMRNIPVITVDLNQKKLEEGREIRDKAGARKVEELIYDVRNLNKEKLGDGATIIIASDTVIHFSKSESDKFINNLPLLLNPNYRGLVYINVPSTDSMTFQYPEEYGATILDERTLKVMCNCSGELKEEPLSFYAKGELEAMLALLGGNILATNELGRNRSALLHEVVVEFRPKKNT